MQYNINRKTKNTARSKNGRIQSPEHEHKDRTIRENRGRNRMEQNPKKITSRTKTDQRNNRDINNNLTRTRSDKGTWKDIRTNTGENRAPGLD